MATMRERIDAVNNDLADRAEGYAKSTGDPRALVKQVMNMGIKAMGTGNFTTADAEHAAAMMIAAIALARG